MIANKIEILHIMAFLKISNQPVLFIKRLKKKPSKLIKKYILFLLGRF